MAHDKLILGAEHDQALMARLGNVLRSLGYDLGTSWEGVGGSQEIAQWVVVGPRGELAVEAETYMGLSISGAPELLAEVEDHFPVAR